MAHVFSNLGTSGWCCQNSDFIDHRISLQVQKTTLPGGCLRRLQQHKPSQLSKALHDSQSRRDRSSLRTHAVAAGTVGHSFLM